MKKIIALISLSIGILVLVGCNETENQYSWLDKYNELEQLPMIYNVWLEVENLDLMEDVNQISVNWNNETDKELMFGKPFTIVKEVNGEWRELKYAMEELTFESIGIILYDNEIVNENYDLSIFDDKFKKGHYRFISSIMIDNIEYSIETEFAID